MSEITQEFLTEKMYEMVKEYDGKKKLKPMDLVKAMRDTHGADKKLAKAALKDLIESGKAVYTYFGGSYVELPHTEGAAK